MITGKRAILSGKEYEGYFPKAEGGNETFKKAAGLKDTLSLIQWVVKHYSFQAEKISRKLRGRTTEETCENIWQFCFRYIQYKEDEKGKEQIRSPARVWSDRKEGVDCDCFTVLISSILTNLGITHSLRITKYPKEDDPDPDYEHIYIVARDGRKTIIIDPVVHRFNYEVPYLDKTDIPMELQFLNGIDSHNSSLRGVDYEDLFSDGLGRTKKERTEQVAQREGMTVAEYNASSRERFIARHGMTPEEWAAKLKAEIAASPRPISPQEQADIERYKQELRNRKVSFGENATRDELISLLKANPKRSGLSVVANKVNKKNPATALLRTGILLAMKTNYFKLAGKLRWYFARTFQAAKAGLSREDHLKITKSYDKLSRIYFGAGGDPAKLKKSILEGRGNRDKVVGLTGISGNENLLETLGPDIYFSEVDQGVLSGLGEPATSATAIGAATVVLTAIAAALKSVKAPAIGEGQGESSETIIPDQTGDTYSPGEQTYEEEEFETEQMRTGETPDPPKSKWKLLQWARDNPLPTAGIGVAIVGGLVWGVKTLTGKKKRKPSPAVAGIPKATSKRSPYKADMG